MAEISPNPYSEELNNFKEEILSHIRGVESKIYNQISSNTTNEKKDYQELKLKMNTLLENNKDIVANMAYQKLKSEKIIELEAFKNKVDGMLITHEVRIKNNLDEIQKMKLKYDKMITENLFVSGFIGNSCQFRNLSEYLSYNISEVSKLKLEREQYKKDIKELKNKLDASMKNMVTLNDNSVKLCNKYTDNKQELFRKSLEVTQSELNHKSMEMRAMIVQFHNESDLKIIDLKKEFDKLLEMKSEFNDFIDAKYADFLKLHDELNQQLRTSNENIDINRKNLENEDKQIDQLDKRLKELHFQVRNYYFVNNKLATLLEKLGANPSKSEIAKLIFGMQGNTINIDTNINSPQPKRTNLNSNLFKMSLSQMQQFKFEPSINVNNPKNNNINKNIGIINPQKNNLIGLKKVNFKDDDIINIDYSEESSHNLDDTIKTIKDDNKSNEKQKNIKFISSPIKKENLKVNIIKEEDKENTKEKNNIQYAKENNKEYIKENNKENNKANNVENIKENKKDNNKDNKKESIKENIKNNIKDNKKEKIKDNIKNSKEVFKENYKEKYKENDKEDYKDKKEDNKEYNKNINFNNDSNKINRIENNINKNSENINNYIEKGKQIIKENIFKENSIKDSNKSIPKINIKERNFSDRKILSSNNEKENKFLINEKVKYLPILTLGSKDNSEEIRKINLSLGFEKKNLTLLIDNNKIKSNNMKKIDIELEEDKKGCKIVELSFPEEQLNQQEININKNNKINKSGGSKKNLVNSFINEYRAKLFTKTHSPEIKIDINNNDIIDMPKKVAQAFGRTTYSFYFKKDAIDCINANKNINNFPYNGSTKAYKFKKNKRIDKEKFKAAKNNNV